MINVLIITELQKSDDRKTSKTQALTVFCYLCELKWACVVPDLQWYSYEGKAPVWKTNVQRSCYAWKPNKQSAELNLQQYCKT